MSLLLAAACFSCWSASASPPARNATRQPWVWNGWNVFPSLYFAADPTGQIKDAARLDKIANFSLVMFEFRMGQFMQNPGWADLRGENFSHNQCKLLRERAGAAAPPCVVYRSGMWAGYFYKDQNALLNEQKRFYSGDTDSLCNSTLGFADTSDTGRQHCRYDLTDPATRSGFVSVLTEVATETPAVSGVFLDNAESVHCDAGGGGVGLDAKQRASLQQASLAAWADAFGALSDKGVYPILSTTNKFKSTTINDIVPWENACPLKEEAVVAALDGVPFARNLEFFMWQLNSTCSAQLQNTMREAREGISTVVHTPWFPNDGGCLDGCRTAANHVKRYSRDQFLEFAMAAFLVSAGEGSYFGFSNMQDPNDKYQMGGWNDVSWQWHDQYADIGAVGHPLGPASVDNAKMVFKREFENGSAQVDCATGSYSLQFRAFNKSMGALDGIGAGSAVGQGENGVSGPGRIRGCFELHGMHRCVDVDHA